MKIGDNLKVEKCPDWFYPPFTSGKLMNSAMRALGKVAAATGVCLGLGSVQPGVLAAQLGVETFLKDISDINISIACWETRSESIEKEGSCPGETREYGVEITFRLLDRPLKKHWVKSVERLVPKTVVAPGVDSATAGTDVATTTYEIVRSKEFVGPHMQLELGLGYSQFDGFRSTDPSIGLRGAVREIPALSLYASVRPGHEKWGDWGSIYGGVRSGLIQLKDVQITTLSPTSNDSTVMYNAAEGQVFQAGLVLGVSAQIQGVSFFIERAWMEREFRSVRWTAGNSITTPTHFPRELDFSGSSMSYGLQISIR